MRSTTTTGRTGRTTTGRTTTGQAAAARTTIRGRGRATLRGRLVAVAAALAVAVSAVGATAPAVAAEPHVPTAYRGSIPAGATLYPGDSLASSNRQYRLVMQGDGNLVEYGVGDRVLFASNTSDKPGAVVTIRADGMLVMTRNGVKVKAWGKSGYAARGLYVHPDGDVVVHDQAKASRWSLGTFQDRVPSGATILSGTWLRPDATTDRSLRMQSNGDLVQYVNGKVVWHSGTSGHTGATAKLRTDGNLVVSAKDGSTLWASGTAHKGPGLLLVQSDSNVVLYGSASTRVWSTRPVTGLRWPVKSIAITGRYGDDRGAGHTPRYHQGTDAAVGTGTPVYASGTGTVTTTATSSSFGNYVIVTYGLTTVLTAHLSKIEVKKGQSVTVGTEIAKSGNTGQSTGPHVHVETRVNGTLKDPLTILHFR